MKKFIYLSVLAAAICAISCETDEIPTYDAAYDAVRFTGIAGGNRGQSDPDSNLYTSTDSCSRYTYSFVDTPHAESYDYELPVYLIGNPSSKDRAVGYEIDPELTNAPDGTYEILSATIPAGAIAGAIRIRLQNVVPDEESYAIALRLKPSDELMVGNAKYLKTILSWNNSIPWPTAGDLIRTYNSLIVGMAAPTSTSNQCLSSNGLKAIVAATGWNDWDDQSVHGSYYNPNNATYKGYKYLPRWSYLNSMMGGAQMAYARTVAEYLEQYKAEHDGQPLLHDAGAKKGQPVTARSY